LVLQAKGHGISSSFLDEIRKVAREFFQQPMEEKKKYVKGVADTEGYGGDPVPEEGQPLDWSDRLFLDVYPEDRRKPKFWPESPASFRCFHPAPFNRSETPKILSNEANKKTS
jgi:isopenicillin N synthase-like dioxygenase